MLYDNIQLYDDILYRKENYVGQGKYEMVRVSESIVPTGTIGQKAVQGGGRYCSGGGQWAVVHGRWAVSGCANARLSGSSAPTLSP